MKKLVTMFVVFILLYSCTTLAVKDSADYLIQNDVSIRLDTCNSGLKKITKNKDVFAPIQKNQRIVEAQFTFINEGVQAFEPLADSVIELICVAKDGSLSFTPAEDPFAISYNPVTFKALHTKTPIKMHSEEKRTYYFTYAKDTKPVYISINRTVFINLNLENDTINLQEKLDHVTRVEKLIREVNSMTYEDIAQVMKEFDIEIDDTDSRNYSMLLSAIVSYNDGLVEYLILNGANILKETLIQGYVVTPLHAAVLSCNAYAVDFLLSEGAVLEDSSGNSPASLAVKTVNIPALEFLQERGYDFSELKIRDDVFTNKLFTPQVYARRNSYKEVEEFFSNLSQ